MKKIIRKIASFFSEKKQSPLIQRGDDGQIFLWPGAAPGSEGRIFKETAKMISGEQIVTHVDHPSVTPFLPPAALATGVALIIAPGGGHKELWMDHEGFRPAGWFSERGVAAFVLKYRLAGEPHSGYTVKDHALPDLQRAIRYVRAHAGTWGIHPSSIGVMGFSAGGELAALASVHDGGKVSRPLDKIDLESACPDFQVLIYPAGINDLKPGKKPPPLFLLGGYRDDPEIVSGMLTLYQNYKQAGAPAEMHLYADAAHGFGIREENRGAVTIWPVRVMEWLAGTGILREKS